ncbi:MAG TPA: hypothetical protein DCZ95_10530 [Verrucomicrobia bacterium]|nr:MAG: hypothetical protein A2X46_18615 [Lentisphaerae bacterium GWF2_57_35]HBA84518.1 hypothetical protein [Verrucomicrobiota bacterium]
MTATHTINPCKPLPIDAKESLGSSAAGDLALSVRHVSKKLCSHTRRRMRYGFRDLAWSVLGFDCKTTELRKSEFWALKDIHFDVRRGEMIGIIGDNGSGKSTLLRLIADILPLDEGEIVSPCRIGAMISLGVGFHPQLTGRQNVFINGAILGMSHDDIRARLDDIISFADLHEFLDAPLYSYSQGMLARLGFSIAVNAGVEVLLIDEVLAVGDVGFRNKCLQRLQQKLQPAQTLLFVSHDLNLLSAICDRTLWLEKGRLLQDGSSDEVVSAYLRETGRRVVQRAGHDLATQGLVPHEICDGRVFFKTASAATRQGEVLNQFDYGSEITFRIAIETTAPIKQLLISLWLSAFVFRDRILFSRSVLENELPPGHYTIHFTIPQLPVQPGTYLLGCGMGDLATGEKIAVSNDLLVFDVAPLPELAPKGVGLGYIRVKGEWAITGENIPPHVSFQPFGEVGGA